jgi:hypothetical protein
MSTGNLHHAVDQSWPSHHLLGQREQRPDLIGGAEEIGVVHHRDRKRRHAELSDPSPFPGTPRFLWRGGKRLAVVFKNGD